MLYPLKGFLQVSPPLLIRQRSFHLAQNRTLVILHLLNVLDKSGKTWHVTSAWLTEHNWNIAFHFLRAAFQIPPSWEQRAGDTSSLQQRGLCRPWEVWGLWCFAFSEGTARFWICYQSGRHLCAIRLGLRDGLPATGEVPCRAPAPLRRRPRSWFLPTPSPKLSTFLRLKPPHWACVVTLSS